MRGLELGLIPVPCYSMMIDCDLVQGIVPVVVRPVVPLGDVVKKLFGWALCCVGQCAAVS